MDMQRLLTSLSSKIILQFAIVCSAAVALVGWNFDVIRPFYLENQLTNTGIVINSAILGLLAVGLANIVYHLLRYRREEAAIAAFVANIEALKTDLTEGLAPGSLVTRRHNTMRSIDHAGGEINHAALAAMTNADEATHFGLIRFINNILILTGVFGTIVSLSIALLGASDLIDSADASLGGMGLVIHGMSTALSTTITAIVAYVLFGYFYTRLNDVQTHCLSGIEHLTSVYLLPRYVKTSEDVAHEMSDLLASVGEVTERLQQTQGTYQAAAEVLHQAILANQQQIEQLGADLQDIKRTLREGFRLPERGEDSQP